MAYIGKQPVVGNFQICDAISVVNGQAAYTMQVGSVNVSPESANHMIVSLNGTIQKPNSSYTVSGSTITFSSNLVTGDVIDFIQILGDVLSIGTPSDATVSLAKLTATGTKDATTFLRGDNTFASAGADADNYFATSGLSSKDLGVGLHIKTGDSGVTSANTSSDELIIEGSGTAGLGILTGSGGNGVIDFGDSADNNIGRIIYNHTDNAMQFHANASERMRIDSSGRVAIGSSTVTGATLYVPADGQTTDAWVRHGSTAYASGSWGGGKQVQVDWQILHSVSYVFEFLTASYGSRKHFVVGSYYPGSSHQTIMTDNGGGTMTQGGASSGERWTSSGGTHGVYCVRITSAQGLDNALVTLI
jgi:hypothetical protein